MTTVIVPRGQLDVDAAITLDQFESHHLTVRRAKTGSKAVAIDGAGHRARGELHQLGTAWQFRVESVEAVSAARGVTIAVAAGDRERFLWLCEKCAELGVSRIIPLVTERSANVESRLRDVHMDKAQRRAEEGCKQSGNPWFPDITPLTALRQVALQADGVCWLLAAVGGSCCDTIADTAASGWLIGPEGGFTQQETEWIVGDLGATPVSLGSYTLRFETAAIVAAARSLTGNS